MHELADRTSDDASSANAEQALGCGVEVSDQQRVVEHDERGRQSLEDVARIGSALSPARCAERLDAMR
jgi:hypothetical protein